MPPLLLISVRNAAEATIAVDCGADIIDVKEPDRGSLGRAEGAVVSEVVQTVESRRKAAQPPVSMALGELIEFSKDGFAIPRGISAVKLGLSRCRGRRTWRADWAGLKAECDTRHDGALNWVAVIYADANLADSPSAHEIIEAGAELGCCGVLIDTYSKSGTLWDFVDVRSLNAWLETIHRRAMFAAVAGSLRLSDLPRLSKLPVDVVAVRGAVCAEAKRQAGLDCSRVKEFREAVVDVWQTNENVEDGYGRADRVFALPELSIARGSE